MNKTPKLAFRVSSETSNGFKHLSFQILKRQQYDLTSMDELLVIRFQSDRDNKGWYGMRTTVEARNNSINHLSEALKLIKKIAPENEYGEMPEKLIQKFSDLKIERVEYDSRLSQYVTEKTIPDVSLTRWMDGYNSYNREYGCSIAVLAENESDARSKIMKEFGDSIAKGSSSSTFEKWLAAGKPVEENTGCYKQAARFVPMAEIAKPLN